MQTSKSVLGFQAQLYIMKTAETNINHDTNFLSYIRYYSKFDRIRECILVEMLHQTSSMCDGLALLTSQRQIQDGGPTTSDPRWRSPRREIQDGGPTKSDTRWRSL